MYNTIRSSGSVRCVKFFWESLMLTEFAFIWSKNTKKIINQWEFPAGLLKTLYYEFFDSHFSDYIIKMLSCSETALQTWSQTYNGNPGVWRVSLFAVTGSLCLGSVCTLQHSAEFKQWLPPYYSRGVNICSVKSFLFQMLPETKAALRGESLTLRLLQRLTSCFFQINYHLQLI